MVERHLGNQENAADRSVAGDAGPTNDIELLPAEFDARDDTDVGASIREAIGALGGDGKIKVELVALVAVEHSPHQRDSV